MQSKRIFLNNDKLLSEKCYVADRLWTRFIGLMFRTQLPPGEGLLILPSNSIHMWFMRFPIDAVFLRKISHENWEILKLSESLKPWKVFPVSKWGAQAVLEVPLGTVQSWGLKQGDRLCISSPS